MKIDRLLEIVVYLLNHKTATAKQLAERFNVSIRTIQRDMDSISIAGIPLISIAGNKGGYSILQSYKLENHFVKKDDFKIIIMALKSLSTGYENMQLESILDKYMLLSQSSVPNIYIDYGVSKEDN